MGARTRARYRRRTQTAARIRFLLADDHVMLARILIAQERLDEATRLLPRLLEAAEAGGRTARSIEILNLQALAFQARGEPARAMTALERALTLAEPEGFVRIFVDEGPPMARSALRSRSLVGSRQTMPPGCWPPSHDRRTAMQTAAPSEISSSDIRALVEPLSERELEVLQLIAEGLTNPEIASRLFLSLNTVKAHTRNIYGKLDVHSRTQAVARARALGVLPST